MSGEGEVYSTLGPGEEEQKSPETAATPHGDADEWAAVAATWDVAPGDREEVSRSLAHIPTASMSTSLEERSLEKAGAEPVLHTPKPQPASRASPVDFSAGFLQGRDPQVCEHEEAAGKKEEEEDEEEEYEKEEEEEEEEEHDDEDQEEKGGGNGEGVEEEEGREEGERGRGGAQWEGVGEREGRERGRRKREKRER